VSFTSGGPLRRLAAPRRVSGRVEEFSRGRHCSKYPHCVEICSKAPETLLGHELEAPLNLHRVQ